MIVYSSDKNLNLKLCLEDDFNLCIVVFVRIIICKYKPNTQYYVEYGNMIVYSSDKNLNLK